MATIKDIAQLAEVSKTTVSRVLNGRADVDPVTEARVRAVVAATGYVPSASARALVHGRRQSIGFLVPSLELPWLLELLRGVSDEAALTEHTVELHVAGERRALAAFTARVAARAIDGLVAVVPRDLDQDLVTYQGRGLPIVLIDDEDHKLNVSRTWATDHQGIVDATRHLIARGRTTIATITGPLACVGARKRLAGYREALDEAGLALDQQLIVEGDWTVEDGERITAELLSLRPDIDAIVGANDLLALGAIRAVIQSGRSVPGEVAVVGYDDIPAASQSTPALTTSRQPLYEMGRWAASEVMRGLGDPNHQPATCIFPTALIVRDSCGGPVPVALGDLIVNRERSLVQQRS